MVSALCLPCEISLSLRFSVVYSDGHRILELHCPEGHDPRPDLTRGCFPPLLCWRLGGCGAGTPVAQSGELLQREGTRPRGTWQRAAPGRLLAVLACACWAGTAATPPPSGCGASPAEGGGLQQVRTPHLCHPNPLGRAA